MRAELLAPAGSFESLRGALLAGADAVYLGGNRFGARAYAENLSGEQLTEAIDLCHLQKKKLYLTVNTLLKDEELEGELYAYLAPLYAAGLDAVIVQDLGAFRFLRREFPLLPIHASTQMTVHSACGAAFLADAGASRVVTSRELSLAEIRQIREETDIEIESFVHGALCYCYSGQCLLSSMIGGRSGNRGRCAQPCRLPYSAAGVQKKYLLSPKDICTLEILPQILDAGVFSLKIEGRMKKPAYTAEVVRVYRKYLDRLKKDPSPKVWRVDPADLRDLCDLYNRGGFSKGYYVQRNGKSMMSPDCPSHFGTPAAKVLENNRGNLKLKALEPLHRQDVLGDYTLGADVKEGAVFSLRVSERLRQGDVLRRTRNAALAADLDALLSEKLPKEKIKGILKISKGEPVILELDGRGQHVWVSGDTAQPARTQGLTKQVLIRQLKKTGDSPFLLEELTVEAEPDCFLPLQSVNELRRRALFELQKAVLASCRRTCPERKAAVSTAPPAGEEPFAFRLFASVQTEEQLAALLAVRGVERVYLDADALPESLSKERAERFQNDCHRAGKACWIALPRIFRADMQREWIRAGIPGVLAGYDGILLRNMEEYRFLSAQGCGRKDAAADFMFYLFNRETREFWRERGLLAFTASPELNRRELEEVGCGDAEIIAYGRLPVMVTAQCLKKTTGGCTKTPEVTWLRDRKGAAFPVKNHCGSCQNTIYNSAPLNLCENRRELMRIKPRALRLSFTVEDAEETRRTAAAFASVFAEGGEIKKIEGNFTRGHFMRGVE